MACGQLIYFVLFLGLMKTTLASKEQEALERHNFYRRAHNAPMMTLDSAMSRSAQAYAEKIASMGKMLHTKANERPGQGENLAMACQKGFTGATAVDMWYNEVCKYNFDKPGFSGATGHFTQVVWKDSTELGIGIASMKRGKGTCYYVVGRYRKAGNTMGAFEQNVVKGCFDRSYCKKKGSSPCPVGQPEKRWPINRVEKMRLRFQNVW